MLCSSRQDCGTTLGTTHSSLRRVWMAKANVIPARTLIPHIDIAFLLRNSVARDAHLLDMKLSSPRVVNSIIDVATFTESSRAFAVGVFRVLGVDLPPSSFARNNVPECHYSRPTLGEDLKSLHPFTVNYFNHQHHFGAPGVCMNMSASL